MSRATDPVAVSAHALASVWAGALTGFGDQVGEHPATGTAAGASFGVIAVAPAQLDVETMSDAGLLR
ncbi:MAG: hypothetical protein LH605_03275, partial [Microbacteriaceae bacterium]|nr:hypothetical protein [Microbacteriaceae bacterium]